MSSFNWLKIFSIMSDMIIALKFVSSGIMCIYGYKWSKGLIAIMSIHIGFSLSILATYVLFNMGMEEVSFLAIPLVTFIFYIMAYKNITLNHFLAIFLVIVKISVLFFMFLMQNRVIYIDLLSVLMISVILGVIFGIIACSRFNNYILLLCISFIGATEFVPEFMDLINGTLFVVSGNFSFIFSFDPADMILSFLGIEIPSTVEILLIMLIFVGSFWIQMNIVKRRGIDLTRTILDDTGDKVRIVKKP